jgi:hypothetical protein
MRILYVPTVLGGTSMNPFYRPLDIDTLGVLNNLASQGHDVWIREYYRKKGGKLLWPNTLPFWAEAGFTRGFDKLLVSPSLANLLVFLNNPAIKARPNNYVHSELIFPELAAFDGPIECISNDLRDIWTTNWKKDWRAYGEKALNKPTNVMSKQFVDSFITTVSKVKLSFMTTEDDRWGAKWAVENLLDKSLNDKAYDFVFDGLSKWSQLSNERQGIISLALSKYPNCATVGRLKIEGLECLHPGKFLQLKELNEYRALAKYCLLSWEPFHKDNDRLWTPRTIFGLASNSVAFTVNGEAPFPSYALGDQPEPNAKSLSIQHQILEDFAAKDRWPCPYEG